MGNNYAKRCKPLLLSCSIIWLSTMKQLKQLMNSIRYYNGCYLHTRNYIFIFYIFNTNYANNTSNSKNK